MSWRTHRVIVAARSATRRLGLNRALRGWIASSTYEAAYFREVTDLVAPGDCVWDVGANLGFYTRRFSTLVGPSGRVVAFEPSEKNRDRLAAAVSELKNVTIRPEALGDRSGVVSFVDGTDEVGATSRVLSSASAEPGSTVPIERGDTLIRSGVVPAPTVLKIDVEGLEYDALSGLHESLMSPLLRAVCVEVHFGLLEEWGQRDAPAAIEQLLIAAGFRMSWTDASHLIGRRSGISA